MYDIILCEGETDAILISYYLQKVLKYEYMRKTIANMPMLSNVSKVINWYKNSNDRFLAICPIGGTGFLSAVQEIMRYNKGAGKSNTFNKLAVVMDYDDESVINSIKEIGKNLFCEQELSAGQWVPFKYDNDFSESVNGSIACILQPSDEHGALETFVLKALSRDDTEIENVVKQSETFVDKFRSERYLRHRRDKVKAKLSVSLSVISPDRTFTTINEFLENIEWKDYQGFQNQFSLFKKLNETDMAC